MSRLFVTYPSTPGARFDRDYYVSKHLPLAMEQWGPFGIVSAQAFFPAKSEAAEVAIAILTFSSDETMATALGSPATATVLGDVTNYTDIEPALFTGVPFG